MSEFKVQVVRLVGIEKHPNADSLSVVKVNGDYPVVFQTSGFSEGDLAVYVPIDSIVPDTEEWKFLGGHRRIKAKKLRGIFSMGMLAPLPLLSTEQLKNFRDAGSTTVPTWEEGFDVQALMGIVKYEPAVHAGQIKPDDVMEAPPWFPRYTDIEGLRKNKDVLVEGEEVVITEKVHGSNGRWASEDLGPSVTGEFESGGVRSSVEYVGSHNCVYKPGQGGMWHRALEENNSMFCAIADNPKLVFFGEVFGNVQDLKYGLDKNIAVRIFDVFDGNTMQYLDYDVMKALCDEYDIKTAPVLYRGPWHDGLRSLAEGKTTVGGDHVREGFVVKPVKERFDRRCGRVILKMIGEGYLLRKGA